MLENALQKLYTDLASALFQAFAIRKDAYAIQMPDGAYKAVKRPLTRLRIRQMLLAKESLLTYQFEGSSTRWLCLDFDVPKKALQGGDSLAVRLQQIETIRREVQVISTRLLGHGIEHLVEFSGNRGFHIWLLFEQKVSRKNGHALLAKVMSEALKAPNPDVNIDFFPAAAASTAEFGHGVKLPLSVHTKSGYYSYLIEDIRRFEVSEKIWVRSVGQAFLQEQLRLLRKNPLQAFQKVSEAIDLAPHAEPASTFKSGPKYIRADPTLKGGKVGLKLVQEQLSQCCIIRDLFERSAAGEKLSEKERLPIVGLMVRLRSKDDPQLGQRLATEFFESLPGFDAEVTRSRLSKLKLFPPTCNLLKSLFPQVSCECGGDSQIKSPLEFLAGLDEATSNPFLVTEDEASSIAYSQINYTRSNDEVALVPTLAQLRSMNPISAARLCNNRSTSSWPPVQAWTFTRTEEDGKQRELCALSARDKVWSTSAIRKLDRLYAFDFSSNSFGYRMQPEMAGGQIFRPWLPQWKAFTGRLSRYIFPPHCDDFGLVKFDIKSYYSSIDLERLRAKLYDGPTEKLALFLSTLRDEQRRHYQDICKDLIELCRVVQEGRSGVPQGPAFARYLAEVFLMEFDQQIEKLQDDGVICYARYVDDIFLITDYDSNLATIEKTAGAALTRLGLQLNSEKHYTGKVLNYRSTFARYRQDTKYLVDQVSRKFRSSSEEEIKNAANRLQSLVEGEFGEGPYNEHLSFLYTHLEEDPSIHNLRRKYELYILGLNEGRGSFFSNFFSFYLSSGGRISSDADRLEKLTGLRRQVFINALLHKLQKGEVAPSELPVIRRVLTAYVETSSILDKELMACIAVLELSVCPEGLFQNISEVQLLRILGYPLKKKQLPQGVFASLLNALWQATMPDFTVQLHDILFTTEMADAEIVQLGEIFFNRVITEIREPSPENHKLLFFRDPKYRSENFPAKHYNLVCLVSCIHPNRSPTEQEALWKSMISSYNDENDIYLENPVWVGKLGENITSHANLNTILVASIGDGFAPGEADHYELFVTYKEYLALCILLPQSQLRDVERSNSSKALLDDLRALLEAQKAPFLKWILDTPPADFYPNRNECLENIVHNDIMLLIRGDELLVRLRAADVDARQFSHLQSVTNFEEGFMRSKYRTVTYKYAFHEYENIAERMNRSQGLIGYVEVATQVYREAEKFSDSIAEVRRFVNVLAKNAQTHKKTALPLVPYTIYGQFLIESAHETALKRTNDSSGLLEGLLGRIRNSGRSMLGFSHECNLNAAQFVELLKLLESDSLRLTFLEQFVCRFLRISNPTVYDLEYCKAASILAVTKEALSSGARAVEPVTGRFFHYYLSTRERSEVHLLLLFDALGGVKSDDLQAFYTSIFSSVDRFCRSFEYDMDYFDLAGILEAELNGIISAAQRTLGQSRDAGDPEMNDELAAALFASDFRRCSLEIDSATGEVRVDGELVVSRTDNTVNRTDVYVCILSGEAPAFRRVGEHFQAVPTGRSMLAYQFVDFGVALIVAIGGTLTAAFDRLEKRQHSWQTIVDKGKANPKQSFYVNARKDEHAVRAHPKFSDAASVVAEHHGCNISHARTRLLRWLLCFPNVRHREVLTHVIAAHEVIREDDRKAFILNLDTEIAHPGTVLCPIKILADVNGTLRLIFAVSGAQKVRELKLDSFVRVLSDVGPGKPVRQRLVVFSDVCISGSQVRKALRYYLDPSKYGADDVETEKWHVIPPDKVDLFREGFRGIKHISFVFALYASDARQALREFCESELGIPPSAVSFHGRKVDARNAHVFGNPNISQQIQQEFFGIVSDFELLESLFVLGMNKKEYRKSLPSKAIMDAVARFGSMPKMGAGLLWLKPLDSSVEPLFDRIDEHPRDR